MRVFTSRGCFFQETEAWPLNRPGPAVFYIIQGDLAQAVRQLWFSCFALLSPLCLAQPASPNSAPFVLLSLLHRTQPLSSCSACSYTPWLVVRDPGGVLQPWSSGRHSSRALTIARSSLLYIS